jgi:hypothetical protein
MSRPGCDIRYLQTTRQSATIEPSNERGETVNHKQQSIATRQTVENDTMEAHNGTPNDAPLSSIITAHLQINNLLCQDDIDILSGQMLAAPDDRVKRDILVLWMDWLEAEEKYRGAAEANDTGYPGGWLVEFYWQAKAEQAREKVEAIL